MQQGLAERRFCALQSDSPLLAALFFSLCSLGAGGGAWYFAERASFPPRAKAGRGPEASPGPDKETGRGRNYPLWAEPSSCPWVVAARRCTLCASVIDSLRFLASPRLSLSSPVRMCA